MPLAELNKPPLKGARCVNCQQPLSPVTLPHEGQKSDWPDHLVAYYCAQENCTRYGTLTLNHRLPLESAAEPKK